MEWASARGYREAHDLAGLRSVLAGERPHAEALCHRPAAPRPRTYLVTTTSLQGGAGGAVVVHTDVTELEEAKAALETSLREVRELNERVEAENVLLNQQVRRARGFDEVVGASPVLGRVLGQVEQVAPTDAPVLLLGETGTGKGLVARALHERSRRRERPLVTVSCAALPATLVESELFGYEKGAFTGALQRTVGRFEVAHGGSLFLDEIGELPLEVQAKLLRVLQTGQFERLGSSKTIQVDVRLIAATNRDLEREVGEGRFRADLYYRLSVFPIALPPLRERREDIPLLVWHFITRRQGKLDKLVKRVPGPLMQAFTAYSWPGNVRELENVVERALIMTSGPTLADPAFLEAAPAAPAVGPRASLAEAERSHIRAVLDECRWKISGKGNAAERLGLNRSTLQFRMKKLGISRPES
jgi:transcriptional regulator with GAF, ATPase, and Fis domain